MKIETYRCDVCGIQKGETNHWWIITLPDLASPARSELILSPATDDQHRDSNDFDLCGAACVQKKVAEFLEVTK